jgi:hypothetical protein
MKFIIKLLMLLLVSDLLICTHINIKPDESILKKKTTKRKLIKKVHKFLKNEENETKNTDNNIISNWVFIPLTVLIFIMTIVSIIGFLILILNSASTDPSTTAIKNNLTRNELNELLRIKQKITTRMMSNLTAPPRLE